MVHLLPIFAPHSLGPRALFTQRAWRGTELRASHGEADQRGQTMWGCQSPSARCGGFLDTLCEISDSIAVQYHVHAYTVFVYTYYNYIYNIYCIVYCRV